MFTNSQMRSWIQLFPQTFVFANRFLAPAGYASLLIVAAKSGKRFFGNRWLGLLMLILMAGNPLIRGFSTNMAMESFYPAVLLCAAGGFISLGNAYTLENICWASFWIAL